ncbi:excinuclease subunit A [Lentilactobacillus farraginis DSM 18382 = JCM 14108]|uniref:UvrABC system protein A n=2 Tax=Lentilactobacillus farraginis TaxID=390841 RepID=A0A0R1VLC9_9LACO|nr:excinuclease subunit A [Lentilactobacillus farraginis DSM 18382 = JCM 14108]
MKGSFDMSEKALFADGEIVVHGARQNNLKGIDIRIPKKRTTVFVGLSGAGKSSLVFDTIAAQSRRELNETFPSFTQQYLPKYGQPAVSSIDHLPVAIVIEQKKIGQNARSTVATYTGIYSLLRLLFSRVGQPFIGYSDTFSFNMPQGMCKTCQGLGYVDEIDEAALVDKNKSLNQGAITFVSFGVNTWRWRRYADSGLFDNDKPLKDYSPKEWQLLMYAPQQQLHDAPPAWHKTALYEGIIPRIRRSILHKAEAKHHRAEIAKVVTHKKCPDCHGTRLNELVRSNHINGKNIADVCGLTLSEVVTFLSHIKDPLAASIIRELTTMLNSLIDIGLGYLSLDRGTNSLSGGEAQRIKIAKYLNSSLSDLVYILDEPSVGLHPHDIRLVKQALTKLKDQGNTILIVEHNPLMMTGADYAVEIGPVAGSDGGRITFTGTFAALTASDTLTGRFLRRGYKLKAPRQAADGFLERTHLRTHNLKDVSVKVPFGVMTVLSGVAGSGKSSLAQALMDSLESPVINLSQRAASVNLRSTPLTYLGIFDKIRQRFAKANHVSNSLFSYNGKGACPTCKGKGVTITNMAFMDPVVQTCEACHGRRYSPEALGYRYQGHTIADVLEMSVDQASENFAADEVIGPRIHDLQRVGLGYLKLNQSLTTLSGGELQRLSLATQLSGRGNMIFLDEPTAGLHMQDIDKLLVLFDDLIAQGNTLILIEHNLTVMTQADWLIDVGPDAGRYGGQILYAGEPAGILKQPDSYTGAALKGALKMD